MTKLEEKYLEDKRLKVLETIKPICEVFNIKDYDYIVNTPRQSEILKVNNIYIGCSLNSIEAIINELIGYIFINFYCRYRSLGAFDKQTQNQIKKYWLNKECLIQLGILKE
jgi:hypothetical protein